MDTAIEKCRDEAADDIELKFSCSQIAAAAEGAYWPVQRQTERGEMVLSFVVFFCFFF